MKTRKQHPDGHVSLLLAAGRGDGRAFEQLHAALRPAVRDFLASRDGSADGHCLDDMTQEVFLRTWQGAARFEGRASAKTFIFAIAKNVLREELQRRGRPPIVRMGQLDHLEGTYVSEEPKDPHEGDQDELRHAVRRAMAKLTESQRQAIELDQIRRLPRTEALKLANCNPNQFANRLYRAMRSLKRLLSDVPRCILL